MDNPEKNNPDEHSGQPGTYILNPLTGTRERVDLLTAENVREVDPDASTELNTITDKIKSKKGE
jgi:hypothetical protein